MGWTSWKKGSPVTPARQLEGCQVALSQIKEQRSELRNRLSHILAFLVTPVRKLSNGKDRTGNPFCPQIETVPPKIVSRFVCFSWGAVRGVVHLEDLACDRLSGHSQLLPPNVRVSTQLRRRKGVLFFPHPKGNQAPLLKRNANTASADFRSQFYTGAVPPSLLYLEQKFQSVVTKCGHWETCQKCKC